MYMMINEHYLHIHVSDIFWQEKVNEQFHSV